MDIAFLQAVVLFLRHCTIFQSLLFNSIESVSAIRLLPKKKSCAGLVCTHAVLIIVLQLPES